jgi:hypothetical protein
VQHDSCTHIVWQCAVQRKQALTVISRCQLLLLLLLLQGW